MVSEFPILRAALDRWTHAPALFDALVAEDGNAFVLEKTVRPDDPGVAQQRVTPAWPHHLPGELTIALTGQAGFIACHRKGLIEDGWRGHGVRIVDARFSAPVLLGETFYTRVEIGRVRRIGQSIHVQFRFRMWKPDGAGGEIETYRSEQHAIFFPPA
ncbi:MAG TPA: hotdog fold domain-containing protein [Candidatus Limnocylindria bacterium]|nr:hotdog fold domain-containing protein [Candidatus Limnocylindria bacterium]